MNFWILNWKGGILYKTSLNFFSQEGYLVYRNNKDTFIALLSNNTFKINDT